MRSGEKLRSGPARGARRFFVLLVPVALLAGTARSQPATEPLEATLEPLPPPIVAAILETLQDEYRGQALYQRVLSDHGAGLRPFSNVVRAEARHAASLASLLEARGLTAPASASTPEEAPAFPNRREACVAATAFEKRNVALYDAHLSAELPEDVRRVFQHNRDASQYHHLPAFERCAGTADPTSGAAEAGNTASGPGAGRGHGRHRRGLGSCGRHGAGDGEGCCHGSGHGRHRCGCGRSPSGS